MGRCVSILFCLRHVVNSGMLTTGHCNFYVSILFCLRHVVNRVSWFITRGRYTFQSSFVWGMSSTSKTPGLWMARALRRFNPLLSEACRQPAPAGERRLHVWVSILFCLRHVVNTSRRLRWLPETGFNPLLSEACRQLEITPEEVFYQFVSILFCLRHVVN